MTTEDADDQVCEFGEYQWEQDEEWQILVRKLEFPPHYNDTQKEKFLMKRKAKYFKKNVDQDFDVQSVIRAQAAASRSSTASTSSSTDKNTNASASASATNAEEEEESNNVPDVADVADESDAHDHDHDHSNCTSSSHSHSQAQSGSQSQSQSQSRNPYGRYQPPPTRLGTMIAPFLNYFYFAAQWFIFANAVASIVYPPSYTYTLLAVGVTHVIATLQNCGRPRFAAWYGQLIMNEENTMISVYAFILLMGARHAIFFTPIILRSLFMACYLTNGFMQARLPASIYGKIGPLLMKVIRKQVWFNQNVAMSEVVVGLFLVGACFFMSRTVIMTLIYWQVMQARYMMSGYIRLAFRNIHLRISGVLSRVPFLLNLYLKLSSFLSNMVDPASMRQRMEGGGGGGGLSGMASKLCVIM